MATASKKDFNAERFRKLVAHFRNSNANERDNAFHLAIAELGKASADVFRDMPDVVAELIGGAGSNNTDELRRELERQLAQSRAREAQSRAEANENIAEAARRKAQSEQAQEIIDRLRQRIVELEAASTRKPPPAPPPVEDRRPEPPPATPAPPPSSPPRWYEEIPPEPEPETETGEGESAWIEVPKWKAVFWTVLAFCGVISALFAAMIGHPPGRNDWLWLAQQWWAWIVLAVAFPAAISQLPRFASFIEDKLIIEHFPDLCLRIRSRLVSPRTMFSAAALLFWMLVWSEVSVELYEKGLLNNSGAFLIALCVWYGVLIAPALPETFHGYGGKGFVTHLSILIVAFFIGYVATFQATPWTYLSGKTGPALANWRGLVFWAGLSLVLSYWDGLLDWLLDDGKRWKWACGIALALLAITGETMVIGYQQSLAAPAPQAVTPDGSVTPEQRKAFDEWDAQRHKTHHKSSGDVARPNP